MSASCVAWFGGDWSIASFAGAFRLNVNYAASNSNANITAHLLFSGFAKYFIKGIFIALALAKT